jgi:peroxiredoxin
MVELRGLGELNAELRKHGGRVLAIAVDPPEDARRVVESLGLDFSVLCDTKRSVIREFGLVHRNGHAGQDIALPAHILVDRDRTIVWRHKSDRVQDRPHPDEVLRQIQALIEAGP